MIISKEINFINFVLKIVDNMRNWLAIIFLATLSSCNINSSTMFRTSSKYTFSSDTIARNIEYRISSNDILSMNIFTNNGSAFMDKTAGVRLTMASEPGNDGGSMDNAAEFRVDFSGEARFPTIGKVTLKGLTLEEAEKLLEDKYSKFYVNP